jgi:hypothetical protein
MATSSQNMLADQGDKKQEEESQTNDLPAFAANPGAETSFGGAGGVRLDGRLTLLVAPNGLVDFITMDGHFLRGLDPQAYLIAADFHDDDRNVIIDDDALVLFP